MSRARASFRRETFQPDLMSDSPPDVAAPHATAAAAGQHGAPPAPPSRPPLAHQSAGLPSMVAEDYQPILHPAPLQHTAAPAAHQQSAQPQQPPAQQQQQWQQQQWMPPPSSAPPQQPWPQQQPQQQAQQPWQQQYHAISPYTTYGQAPTAWQPTYPGMQYASGGFAYGYDPYAPPYGAPAPAHVPPTPVPMSSLTPVQQQQADAQVAAATQQQQQQLVLQQQQGLQQPPLQPSPPTIAPAPASARPPSPPLIDAFTELETPRLDLATLASSLDAHAKARDFTTTECTSLMTDLDPIKLGSWLKVFEARCSLKNAATEPLFTIREHSDWAKRIEADPGLAEANRWLARNMPNCFDPKSKNVAAFNVTLAADPRLLRCGASLLHAVRETIKRRSGVQSRAAKAEFDDKTFFKLGMTDAEVCIAADTLEAAFLRLPEYQSEADLLLAIIGKLPDAVAAKRDELRGRSSLCQDDRSERGECYLTGASRGLRTDDGHSERETHTNHDKRYV